MPPRDPRRPDRVAAAIREEVARFLADGVKDPRVARALVTVTAVDVTRDLRNATVFVSIMGTDAEKETALTGLASVGTHLRSHIGRALQLRSAPEFTFRLDRSVAYAARIETLLAGLNPPAPPAASDPDVD
ncbi:MAG: 30S ribosome-binding factor RbfA [Gemmatimonadaceae bacterium]|nr:30S ribosome-binding factor RbfA [Gemmatimonadaceae bacterium]